MSEKPLVWQKGKNFFCYFFLEFWYFPLPVLIALFRFLHNCRCNGNAATLKMVSVGAQQMQKKGRVENRFWKQRHLLRKNALDMKKKKKKEKTIKSATGHQYKTMYNDHMVESAGHSQSRAWLQTAQRPINILHNIELYIDFFFSLSVLFSAASEKPTWVRPRGQFFTLRNSVSFCM